MTRPADASVVPLIILATALHRRVVAGLHDAFVERMIIPCRLAGAAVELDRVPIHA
jgi:hypothetical protein